MVVCANQYDGLDECTCARAGRVSFSSIGECPGEAVQTLGEGESGIRPAEFVRAGSKTELLDIVYHEREHFIRVGREQLVLEGNVARYNKIKGSSEG
jgi:hypothetical protein